MKPKSDAVIETQIFRVHGIAMNDALTKCHGVAVATPDEEAHSVRHHLPKSAEVILSQLFEMSETGTLKYRRPVPCFSSVDDLSFSNEAKSWCDQTTRLPVRFGFVRVRYLIIFRWRGGPKTPRRVY